MTLRKVMTKTTMKQCDDTVLSSLVLFEYIVVVVVVVVVVVHWEYEVKKMP
jgi:heme/copper-type cytochrome/quinol oxidase subunit 2